MTLVTISLFMPFGMFDVLSLVIFFWEEYDFKDMIFNFCMKLKSTFQYAVVNVLFVACFVAY